MGYESTPYTPNAGIPLYQKPGMAPSTLSLQAHKSNSGRLGESMGMGTNCVPGNPDKSILGGDNRTDLGLFSTRGNPDPGSIMPHQYDWTGQDLFDGTGAGGNPDPSTIKGWFRGGSDALGVLGDNSY